MKQDPTTPTTGRATAPPPSAPSYTYDGANQLTTGAGHDGNLTAATGYGYTGFSYNPANQTASPSARGRSGQASVGLTIWSGSGGW